MEPERWRISLLGGLSVQFGDQYISKFQMRRVASLLARLAYFPNRQHLREELIDLLWPDEDIDASRSRFRQVLTSLRQSLESLGASTANLLLADRDNVRLVPGLFGTDVAEFENALRHADRAESTQEKTESLKSAIEFYKGELLPGFYEDWVSAERRRLEEDHVGALSALAALLLEAGEPKQAIEYSRRAVAADPLREDLHRNLISLYASAGQPSQALKQYREMEQTLWKELRAVPSPETVHLRDAIQSDAAQFVVAHPVNPTPESPPMNAQVPVKESSRQEFTPSIPAPLTGFFGRENDIETLSQLVSARTGSQPSARLISLTGFGGSGKTRLALEVARNVQQAFHGAVWVIPLASVSTSDGIVNAIVEAICPQGSDSQEPMQRLYEVLNGVPCLLVLDSFEHLESTSSQVVRGLLQRLPELCCVVTSRRRLNIEGELEHTVNPLDVPDEGVSTIDLSEIPSVALFMDRARLAKPSFAISDANAEAVHTLCQRLEGIPLAIELAAAWVAVLSPSQIAERLSSRRDILASDRSDLDERHRSLWATLEWSYQQLPEELQQFFLRLSAFHDGWTIEAAETVCQSIENPNEESVPRFAKSRLSDLNQLRLHSLIQAEDTGDEVRFRMLETMREFAASQLPADTARSLQATHANYYRLLAERAQPNLDGPDEIEWLDKLDAEHSNLRAALGFYAGSEGDAEIGLLFASSLWRFWETRGYYSDSRGWLDTFLARSEGISRHVRARGLLAVGCSGGKRIDFLSVVPVLEECIEVFRELNDRPNLSLALCSLGVAFREAKQTERSRPYLQEALAIAQADKNQVGIARAVGALAIMERDFGNYEQALSLLEQSAAFFRVGGHKRGMAWCVANRGAIAFIQEQHDLAITSFQNAISLFRDINQRMWALYILSELSGVQRKVGNFAESKDHCLQGVRQAKELGEAAWVAIFSFRLGDLECELSRTDAALNYYREALTTSDRADYLNGLFGGFHRYAYLAAAANENERAIRLLSYAQTLGDRDDPVTDNRPHIHTIDFESLRQRVSDETYQRTRQWGETTSREEAIAYAVAASDHSLGIIS